MGVLDLLEMTEEDVRAALRDDGSTVPPAPGAGDGPRRVPAAWGGDPRVEAVLGENAAATALDVRARLERFIDREEITEPMARHLREHVDVRLYEAAVEESARPGLGEPPEEDAFREFLRESGDDLASTGRPRRAERSAAAEFFSDMEGVR